MRIRRLPVVDELSRDGETVVLLDEGAVLLSPLASAALANLTLVWTSDADLRVTLEALFGVAPDPEGAVFALVSDLESAGLVEVEPT
jgi:hypothetical protein